MIWRSTVVLRNSFSFNKFHIRNFTKTFNNREFAKPKLSSAREPHFTEGLEIEGFKVIQIAEIPDFHCKLIRLNHLGTGAQYTHIDRNDSNNVFSIAFRTTPFDSTGLPHVLEHLVLFGSEKYSCRDPFMKMLNRSLATFLNAMTYPDFTLYPFATQNQTDYYNLMSVYLDAVFKPKLRENDFKLESWRLEHEDVSNPQSPIIFKGVVLNEMKGVYSDNQNIFMEHLLNELLPSHTYGVNSGGDPLQIPNLTCQKLVDFHKNHYHPSNAKIYSYGNMNLVDHLKFVNEQYLQYFEYQPEYAKNTYVPREPRWQQPKKKQIYGKHDPLAADPEKQSVLGIGYLVGDVRNVHELFIMKILSQLMTDGPNSTFYKNLIEPNIGCGYAPATGFDSQTRDTTFTIGLQGIHEKDFEKVETIIYDTFEECIQSGFDPVNVENILHAAEVSVKHQGTNFGLQILFSLSPLWNHDGDLANAMKISDHIKEFRKKLEDKHYLQKEVEKYFKNNSHRLILTMSSKSNFEEEQKIKEAKLLQSKLSSMTSEDLEQVYKIGLKLREEQERKDDASCLPSLKISDINKTINKVELKNLTEIPIQICTVPTNGVTYFRSIISTSDVSEELKTFLPLFTQIVSIMGTQKYDYRIFDQMILSKTMGLDFSNHVINDIRVPEFEEGILIESYCLDKNIESMFDLWTILFNEVNLTDLNRFSTLVRNLASSLANEVTGSGHLYAMLNSASFVNPGSYRQEQNAGLTFVKKMKEIAGNSNLDVPLENMRKLADILLNKKRIRCALNVSPENKSAIPNLLKFLSNIPGSYEGISNSSLTLNISSSLTFHHVLPLGVNYVAKSVPTIPYSHEDHAALRVLSQLLTTKYLLPLIRERYGAYGAGAKLGFGGVFQFYSYRDPNNLKTLDIFNEAVDWVTNNNFTEQDIDEAKLGVFRDVDSPIAPSNQGMRLFLNRVPDDIFIQHRLKILEVNRDSLIATATKYLNNVINSASVIIGPDTADTNGWCKVYSE